MNSVIMGFSVTVGLPEIIIFLLAAILMGFSIHFYWTSRKTALGRPLTINENSISEEDQWRLQFYEQIEKHEKNEERLEKEIMRMNEAEKILLNELEETRDEVSRLERIVEKGMVGDPSSNRHISDLVIAQQTLNESLSREMTERLQRAYEEFNFLQDRVQKIQEQLADPNNRAFEIEEMKKSYLTVTRDYDELKLKHLAMIEENQRLTRLLADSDEQLRDASFHKQQLSRKVRFLEDLTTDLQQVAGHHKNLEGQLRRITEIESLLSRAAQDKP